MPVVPTLDVENYLDFKAMTRYLKEVSSAAPHLVRAFSIGKSREGRHLLVAEVTNRNLREGRQKPGIWIDGGHQGWNLLGSTACLELLRFLVAGHGRDEFLTELVDHTVFYIAPRLAPDEMELCLQNGALVPQRLDDDPPTSTGGRQFRVPSELGGWKPFKRDHRVMVPRNPEDRKGQFFDLYRQVDEDRIREAGPADYPSPVVKDRLPLQLPSTRAIFEFMRSYDNVFGVVSTSGPGDRLRLVSDHGGSRLIRNLGHRLGELSGLPFLEVTPAGDQCGGFLGWVSRSLGVLAMDCHMWSLRGAAGLKENDAEDPFKAEDTEILQLLRFCEKEFPEGSFGEWTEMEDPVLGKGEVGGWDWSRTWLNPPSGPYLSRELKKLSRLALGLASAGPRLRLGSVKETVIGWSEEGEPLRQLSVEVENAGYMPTCPVETGRLLRGQLELKLGANALLMGDRKSPLEDLSGSGVPIAQDGLPSSPDSVSLPRARSLSREFLVKGSDPVEVIVRHPLAGLESTTSRPPQGIRPPAFSPSAPASPLAPESAAPVEDPFDEVFPSFEELYQEPVAAPPSMAPPAPPPPPPPERRPSVDLPPLPPQEVAESEFNIPDPIPTKSEPKAVQFAKLEDTPAPGQSGKKSSPFPSGKPGKGRVFGSPPQKPGGGLPAALSGGKTPSAPKEPRQASEGEFSPLPLVKPKSEPSSAFEPISPLQEPSTEISSKVLGETVGGDVPAPNRSQAPDQKPSAPPARLSRMSAPQLLRRQRGQGPKEPFKRS